MREAGPSESAQAGSARRVHVLGAGPVGLMVTALLQPVDGLSLHLYEKRREYTRTRMVQLAPYLVADSLEAYRADHHDGDNVEAVFEPGELAESLAYRQSMPSDLVELLRTWTQGFCPLNEIERSLSELIDSRNSDSVTRTEADVSTEEAIAMLGPADLVIDCSGTKSLLRDHLGPGSDAVDGGANTQTLVVEHALVITFLYSQTYACNEFCKYYKNVENANYKFIPMVHRVCFDGSVTHVTGIVTITPEEYESMPKRFDGEWLSENYPTIAQSMDRFVDKIKQETHGEVVSDVEIIRIPLNLYRARHATSQARSRAGAADDPLATTPVFLLGDSAIGSPYFQSISLGFECAMYLGGLIAQPQLAADDALERYESYIYKQWMRVYMQSKLIKNNKELFHYLDDPSGLLDRLHIY